VRLSAFNIYVADSPDPGSTLVYNTFSGGFVVLDAETLGTLRKADAGAELDRDEQERIDPDFFDSDVGILVQSRQAEERDFRDWFEKRRSSTAQLNCILSTTFACNFDCTYCCQSDVLNGRMMNPVNGAKTAEWLANRALEIGAETMHIDFVGGEPLLHPDRLEQIVNDIRRRAPAVRLTFGLITNGYYLTRDLVERWKPMGLTGAQVTLDGDETTHDLTRRSKKKGEETFDRIFKNVIAVAPLIDININGNYESGTVHGFVPLIKKLQEAGSRPVRR
jgi:uncharacterized protein